MQITLRRVDFAGRPLLSVVWQDVTQSRLHADRIRRLNQAYAVLSEVNEAIVRLQDSAALQAAVAGMDAVLSAAHFSTMEPHAIIEPVKRAGVKRLLVVGGAGSLLLPSGHRVIDSPDFPEAYKAEASAGVRFLEALRREPNLDWTFLSPSAEFVEGERRGHYTLGKDHLLIGADGKSWITFADYAIAMLDELEKPQHSRQRFTVGY